MVTKRHLLIRFLRENWSLTFATLMVGILANLLTIILPISLGKYFDLVFGFNSHRAHFLDLLPFSFWKDTPSFLLFFLGLVLLRTLFYFFQNWFTGVLGERFSRDVRYRLFERQLRIKTAVYDQKGIGKYLLRYSGDMKSLQNYLKAGIVQFAIDMVLLATTVLFLAWLSDRILLIASIGFAGIVAVIYFLNKTLYNVSVPRRNQHSQMLAFVNERLLSALTIKAFNNEQQELQKFEKRSDILYDRGVKFQRVYNLIFALVPGMLYLVLGMVLWSIYRMHSQGTGFLEGSSMLSFVLLFITVLPVFRRTASANTVWKMGNISFEKLLRVFNTDSESTGQEKFRFKNGRIEFKNLAFGFSKNKTLFRNLSLTIPEKEITVLTASAGFGKSSLIKLLLGIYLPQEGQLLIDGQKIQDLDLKTLRQKITAVSDDFLLLGKFVFEAISYSRAEEKRAEAAKILEELQAGLPRTMHLTLDDKIGEMGIHLSEGQQKILGYARAFLTEKPILLLDEPFVNLPQETRSVIVRKLLQARETHTIVIFATEWNPAWLKADNVIQLDKPQRSLEIYQCSGKDN